jgi:hypothetical protein
MTKDEALSKKANAANKERAMQLAAQATIFTKAGASSEKFNSALVKIITQQMKGKITAENVKDATKKLTDMTLSYSKSLGISVSQAMDLVAGKFPELLVLGGSYEENLKGLAAAQFNTTVSMKSFLDMSKGFDTIEGAANMVGDLNAVLRGTNLGIDEMIAADPADRVKKVLTEIQTAVAEGRVTIAESGQERRYMIQTLADAAKISEEEMNALLNSGMTVDEMFKERIKNTGKGQEELSDRLKDSMTTAESQAVALATAQNTMVKQGTAMKSYMTNLKKWIHPATTAMRGFAKTNASAAASLRSIIDARDAFAVTKGDKDQGFIGTILFGKKNLPAQMRIIHTELGKMNQKAIDLQKQLFNVWKAAQEKLNSEDKEKKEGETASLDLKPEFDKGSRTLRLRADIDLATLRDSLPMMT